MPSLAECAARAAERLAHGPHAERARLDAETLLLAILRKNRAWLLAHPDEPAPADVVSRYAEWVERRSFGEPVQYIVGEVEFYRLPFRVTRDVLIPRPETEHVVERALHLMPVFDRRPRRFFEMRRVYPATHSEEKRASRKDPETAGWPPRVLDVGTGSGCIAISIAHDWSEAEVIAVDLSAASLEVARFNAERFNHANQIRFLQGDLLAPVAGERFELIVSNPPYVAEGDRESLAVEVRDFEPAQALFAGEDGLAVYRRLIPAAHAALAADGWIVLEIGYGQEASVRRLLGEAGFEGIEFAADLQGIARVASGRRS
jgi:release factor glutamine methyltransferase